MSGIKFAPDDIKFASLRVLYEAGVWTRNQTLDSEVPVEQLNSLWEALHPVPELLHQWREDAEAELHLYWASYDERWEEPKLEATFRAALAAFRSGERC
ncbi:MAG: hypothetical protein KC776_19925 [Myxococcales bacterium]|nr:hypothetical protein [Myxococcales bacterium]MCB9576872.1 hypothetical protein [Polyangiaceae bacterium]